MPLFSENIVLLGSVMGVRETAVITILLVLLFGSPLFLVIIQPAEADVISWYNCVVILPNGSIVQTTEPVQKVEDTYTLEGNTLIQNTTQPIQRFGETYSLTDDIFQYTLLVQRNNIVIDGANFTIQGERPDFGGVGIYISSLNNVTVKNIQLTRFSIGVQIINSSNCLIANNTFGNPYNKFADQNENGLSIQTNSLNNLVVNNIFQGGGISIDESYANTFRENRLYDSGFTIGGYSGSQELKDYQNVIESSNSINDAPTLYLLNQTNLVIDSSVYTEIGFLALINCDNVTVRNLTVLPSQPLVLLAFTSNSILAENQIIDEQGLNGVVILNSTNNQILNNNITSYYPVNKVQSIGLYVIDSSNNTISANVVEGYWRGILIGDSNRNIVAGNNVSKSTIGIIVGGSDNNVFGNEVFSTVEALSRGIFPNSGTGIVVGSDNSVYRNTLRNNRIGLSVGGSGIFIYQNNFLDNTNHVNVEQSSNVTWDDGNQGNYWSNYNGTDNNGDGIGDTPYIIDENNRDNYPLMEPTIIPEFASWTTLLISGLIATFLISIIFRQRVTRKGDNEEK